MKKLLMLLFLSLLCNPLYGQIVVGDGLRIYDQSGTLILNLDQSGTVLELLGDYDLSVSGVVTGSITSDVIYDISGNPIIGRDGTDTKIYDTDGDLALTISEAGIVSLTAGFRSDMFYNASGENMIGQASGTTRIYGPDGTLVLTLANTGDISMQVEDSLFGAVNLDVDGYATFNSGRHNTGNFSVLDSGASYLLDINYATGGIAFGIAVGESDGVTFANDDVKFFSTFLGYGMIWDPGAAYGTGGLRIGQMPGLTSEYLLEVGGKSKLYEIHSDRIMDASQNRILVTNTDDNFRSFHNVYGNEVLRFVTSPFEAAVFADDPIILSGLSDELLTVDADGIITGISSKAELETLLGESLGGGGGELTTGTLTASSPLSFTETRAVIGGATVLSVGDAAADGSTKGVASFAANDFNASSGNISLDYANAQAASSGTKGFLTSSDWSTFNSKQAGDATLTSLAAVAGVQGDLLYASGSDTWTRLAKDTNATRYLSNTGSSNNPAWAQVSLTNGVTGDLPFSSLAQIAGLSVLGVTGASTADVAAITAGTDHQILRRSGSSVAFGAINLDQSAATTGSLGVDRGGTNLASIASGSVLAANSADTLSAVTWSSAGTKVLQNASGTISWADPPSGGGVDVYGLPSGGALTLWHDGDTIKPSTTFEANYNLYNLYGSFVAGVGFSVYGSGFTAGTTGASTLRLSIGDSGYATTTSGEATVTFASHMGTTKPVVQLTPEWNGTDIMPTAWIKSWTTSGSNYTGFVLRAEYLYNYFATVVPNGTAIHWVAFKK